MKIYHPDQFTAGKAWGALDIERLKDATVRLHWADEPYIWHVNDGPEIFVVLSGAVEMHVRRKTGDEIHRLDRGDIFHAEIGDEHKAHPLGEARILVIEQAGTI